MSILSGTLNVTLQYKQNFAAAMFASILYERLLSTLDSGIFGQSENPKLLLGPAAVRILSVDRFNQESHPNEMLNGLRYFERSIAKDTKSTYGAKPAWDWGEVDRNSLAKCIISLCTEVKNIMSLEARLLEISAPCYILGGFVLYHKEHYTSI
jgi:hypothetical protein